MFIAFAFEGVGILLLGKFGQDPLLFVILTGLLSFFAGGKSIASSPALTTDIFGSKYAATNSGLLYTAKGTAALLVPSTSALAMNYGWQGRFDAAAGLNIVAARS